ncbi:undecaprenyl-diphosphate phosphatase [Candidatus Marinimicrobia bacterium]|nr:undecaprenyl-diphosphate phosphatase [Candidatus Neomarinimicrobiota bacterium]MDB3883423.1 undecaprenyl-diphosphate phosphatase [Candidatus Neomarinimicrobiota bacterium]
MNELINYLILGFVQGVTEFFPISSSGHLVLFEDFLGINNAGASAEIIAHFGTLFSIILFYRATFFSNKNSDDFFHINTLKMLIVSTIPAVLCGLFFDLELFFNYSFVKTALLFNGALLISLSILRGLMKKSTVFQNLPEWKWDYKTSLFLGFFQALAMLPGISRSGMVISYGLFVGLEKKKIIQYAFFMAVPVILLSIVYKILFSDGFEAIAFESGIILFISSFVFGYFSLIFLIKFLERFSFAWFGLYCIIISLVL